LDEVENPLSLLFKGELRIISGSSISFFFLIEILLGGKYSLSS
jgi:hypothetical protein